MLNLLKNTYIKAESWNKSQITKILVMVMIVFIPLGFIIGYVITAPLTNTEIANTPLETPQQPTQKAYSGKITYVDPNTYPLDKINYVLTDNAGKILILLKAKDEKLVVSEGHFAKLYGVVTKTQDKSKDVLIVEKVEINNATN